MRPILLCLRLIMLVVACMVLPACSEAFVSTIPTSPEETPEGNPEEPIPEDPSTPEDPSNPENPVSPEPATVWPEAVTEVLNLSETPFAYSDISLPSHFGTAVISAFDNTPADNAINDRIATLGRVLFYDVLLSANNTISCASCHHQDKGFSDSATFSTGFEGGLTGRNSMGLINSRFYANGHFFWDERADTLEDQTLMPIQDAVEMGLSLQQLESKLAASDYYPFLFDWAYGDESVTSDRVSRALAQFVRTIVSYESKYDAGLAATGDVNRPFPNFTQAENAGKALFFSRRTSCGACHVDNQGQQNDVFFFMDRPRNNGLDAGSNNDNGVGDLTANANDNGDFKVSSLRNIELTAPYMHDGRLATLEQVVDHYSTGIQNHPNLDNRLRRDGNPVRMNFSSQERANLVAFMRTLTDTGLATKEEYSNPFK